MEQDFELKHRLVGAAVLIFFGVLVLPWWLSPPASELPDSSVNDTVQNFDPLSVVNGVTSDVKLEPDLLEALMAEQANAVDGEEQVLVSRITPLDDGATEGDAQTARSEDKSPSSEFSSGNTESASSADKQEAAPGKPNRVVAPATVKTSEQQSAPSGVPKVENTKIEVGWAVQVGVFTDKIGAGNVVEDLKAKGFNPKTSTVDTNKGPKTGTRVWLGPYEARVDAAKAKAHLTEKTGEPGFIRSFP